MVFIQVKISAVHNPKLWIEVQWISPCLHLAHKTLTVIFFLSRLSAKWQPSSGKLAIWWSWLSFKTKKKKKKIPCFPDSLSFSIYYRSARDMFLSIFFLAKWTLGHQCSEHSKGIVLFKTQNCFEKQNYIFLNFLRRIWNRITFHLEGKYLY